MRVFNMHELRFQPLSFLMQIYSFLGSDDIHLNWIIGVETFSTKKILLGIKKWKLFFYVHHSMHWENHHSYSQVHFYLKSS